ncbi:IclR family transcriptional regulator [Ideonella oryzae]|uniref:IclR family transcriptional regulator n=1 Tax=Ideonella oryzae TaxID=2937441 RepID=A0ABT1BHE7_9BURK|nr:IclR family transcriptional regulator [Ideonella oryzae]MCO5975635.1 IclR family transcriptional regulator [Ideonella oryzae]
MPPKARTAVSPPPPAASAPAPARRPDPLFNQSLEKGLEVLRAFDAAHRTLTLAELAGLTGMSKASAQRTVHTLQVLGYVGKHPQTRRFQLLPKVIELGFNYIAAHPLIRTAHPYLSQLANASGETASLTEAVGTDMVYVAQLLTPKFIPVLTPVGMRVPMYCTSSGRAWLSCLDEAQARALLEAAPRPARTAATLTAVDDILAKVAECRRIGVATNCEELFLGDMGIGAPVVDSRGQPVAAVHIAPPTSRWTLDEAQRKLGPMVIECARAISQAMAH